MLSDVGIGAACARAALDGAILNVAINAAQINDQRVMLALDGQTFGCFTVPRHFHLVCSFSQRELQEALNIEIVFYQEQAHQGLLVRQMNNLSP